MDLPGDYRQNRTHVVEVQRRYSNDAIQIFPFTQTSISYGDVSCHDVWDFSAPGLRAAGGFSGVVQPVGAAEYSSGPDFAGTGRQEPASAASGKGEVRLSYADRESSRQEEHEIATFIE